MSSGMMVLVASFLVTLLAFSLIWLLSLGLEDAGIVDFYWGPGFAVIALLAWWLAGSWQLTDVVFLALLTLWAMRLGAYMTARHSGTEDARYADMRRRHGDAFPIRSLWMVFWLQAVIQWIASSPALVLMTANAGMKAQTLAVSGPFALTLCGITLFLIGFGIEIAADRAVARFKADPENRGRLLTTGLHAHIRHPNYLGEIILQWGLGLIAFGPTLNWLAFAGPALMTALIITLSGVPMLEAQLASRPGFDSWKARTGALLPRFKLKL